MTMPQIAVPVLEARGMSKHYGGIDVLDNVHLSLKKGEVLGIVGDNGAGKSTLIKPLTGAIPRTSGTILFDGRETQIDTPAQAKAAGIETVYQDLALVDEISIVKNVFLGREILHEDWLGRWFGDLDFKKMEADIRALFSKQDVRIADIYRAAQKDAVDRAIDMGVDGIIIGSVDNRAFDASLDKAKAKGIPVVAVDTAIDHPHVSNLAQTDNLAAAGVAGKYIVDQLGGDGSVLIFGGSAGHQTGNARRDGVKSAEEAAGHEVIFQICDWKDACAFETTTNFLQSNPNIKAIFSAWDPGALAAVSASKALGKLNNLIVVGFDGNPANLVAVEAGELSATIKQDNTRMGIQSVQNLISVVNGAEPPAIVPIDGILITSDNVSDFN